jgi:hypothetical protein
MIYLAFSSISLSYKIFLYIILYIFIWSISTFRHFLLSVFSTFSSSLWRYKGSAVRYEAHDGAIKVHYGTMEAYHGTVEAQGTL